MRCCLTCLYWQGRKPCDAKSWEEVVGPCDPAAYCAYGDDGDWQDAMFYCSDYEKLPGAPEEDIGNVAIDRTPVDNIEKPNLVTGDDNEFRNILQINVLISSVPIDGLLQEHVTGLECPRLPFLNSELLGCVRDCYAPKGLRNELISSVEKHVSRLIQHYGFSVGVRACVKEADEKGREYDRPPVDKTKAINLFVDLGSTNSKWIVAEADTQGRSGALLSIPMWKPTDELCAELGLNYDKQSAYALKGDDFVAWLSRAATGFMIHMSDMHKACVYNIMWSFPKIEGSVNVDFAYLSSKVSVALRRYGLIGQFSLIPEAEALRYMFKDRIEDLVRASTDELRNNERIDKKIAENKDFNEREDRLSKERDAVIAQEECAWSQRSLWYRIFHSKNISSPYHAQHKATDFESEKQWLLQGLRDIGASSSNVNLLVLDAGGSTLDFSYEPAVGEHISGSYKAGGHDLTMWIMKDQRMATIEDAENFKIMLNEGSPIFIRATEAVYSEPLTKLRSLIPASARICVVVTGLGMLNYQLRQLIHEKLKLPEGQKIIFSPMIAEAFPKVKIKDYPTFQKFIDIVQMKAMNEGRSFGSPAEDVSGGLYFMLKSRR